MKFKAVFANLVAVDNNVDGGRPLWDTGSDHRRYCMSFTIQPQTATATIAAFEANGTNPLLDASGPYGITLGDGEVFCHGDQEVRGTDAAIDLSKWRVRGNTDITLLIEVPDDN